MRWTRGECENENKMRGKGWLTCQGAPQHVASTVVFPASLGRRPLASPTTAEATISVMKSMQQ
jgi:hypothetical protein